MMKILMTFLLPLLLLLNSCHKELSTAPEEPKRTKCAVFVDSNPRGAKIFVNDRNSGFITPDTVYWVGPGLVKMTLKLELYKDTTIQVVVNEDEVKHIYLDYTINPSMLGKLDISSFPQGANIILNDSDLNLTTPAVIRNLLPGIYKIRLRMEQYWDDEISVTVKSVVSTMVNRMLTDSVEWVNLTTHRTLIPTDYLSSVTVQGGGIKWVGTIDSGLIRYDDIGWKVFNTANSLLPDNKINFVYADRSNTVWAATEAGLVKIEGDNWTLFNTSNSGLTDNYITSVYNDGSRIWIGTFTKGIFTYDGSTWKHYTKSNWYLPSDRINCIAGTPGEVWIGTDRGALKYVNDSLYKHYNVEGTYGSLPSDQILSIAVDKNDRGWMACGVDYAGRYGGTCCETGNNNFLSFRETPSIEVYSIYVDAQNTVWCGSYNSGLSRYLYGEWIHYRKANSKIGTNHINCVTEDANGHKWLASYGSGLIKYKGY